MHRARLLPVPRSESHSFSHRYYSTLFDMNPHFPNVLPMTTVLGHRGFVRTHRLQIPYLQKRLRARCPVVPQIERHLRAGLRIELLQAWVERSGQNMEMIIIFICAIFSA